MMRIPPIATPPPDSLDELQEPLFTPRRRSVYRRVVDLRDNLRPSWPWIAGATGSGLVQAALAVSARPDARAGDIAAAGTAMTVGTWLYGEGVRPTMQAALSGESLSALLEAAVAAGSYLGVAAGVALAAETTGPARILGVGLVAVATQGFHHTLSLAFLRRTQGGWAPPQGAVQAGRGVVVAMAALALVGAGVAVGASRQLSPAYAAGVGLFCHALLGTAWSTWREDARPR